MADTYLPIRLLIADDHEVYRDGLRSLLSRSKEFDIVGEAANGQQLIQLAHDHSPDVVLTDIMMPVMDGIEATAYLTKNLPSVGVIALSMFNQDNLILDMINSGAKGYLIKNAHKSEIVEAIQSVSRNQPYYCRTTSLKLAKLIASSKIGSVSSKMKPVFSEKELNIIKLICAEKTNKEIGDVLFLSARTVEEYRQKIREKMEVKSTAGIVIYAIKNDLFKVGTD